jgi:hypothetical protein
VRVLAKVGSVKEMLYNDGVRYFKFPNNAGTYNIIDWKTGEKSSTKDRAPSVIPKVILHLKKYLKLSKQWGAPHIFKLWH